MNTRIDQFGVAQPSINPNPDRGIITVELPGIKDKERVRKYLQSSANLQFWETYQMNNDMVARLQNVEKDFDAFMKGKLTLDTAAATPTTTDTTKPTVSAPTASTDTPKTSSDNLSEQLGNAQKLDTPGTTTPAATSTAGQRSLSEFLKPFTGLGVGMVEIKDTAMLREYLSSDVLRRHFPSDAAFAYGKPEKSNSKQIPLYILKTNNREKAIIEGEAVTDAKQDFEPTSGKPIHSIQHLSARWPA